MGLCSPFHKEMLMGTGVSHEPGSGGTTLLPRLFLLLQLYILYGKEQKGLKETQNYLHTEVLGASATGRYKFKSTLISSFLLMFVFFIKYLNIC